MKATKAEQEAALTQIILACNVLGWDIAFPSDRDDDPVIGMVIGLPGYVEEMVADDDGLHRKLVQPE